MEKKSILIALRDTEETGVFTASLAGLNHDLVSVPDGAKALELSLVSMPSLLVADTDLPVISGERLFQILRSNPQTSRIPFVFISSAVKDIKGFRTGIDIFLLRPINTDELVARVRHTLSTKGQSALSKGIEGRLAHISLPDIIQFMHMNRKEGELRINRGEQTGVVLIKDGEVYNAVINGVEKEKAFFRLLEWEDGRFEFIPKQVLSARKIRASAGNLLMEGMRQIDELNKRAGEFPSPDAMLELRSDPSTLPKGLQPVIYDVIQAAARHPLVADIVNRTSYPDYEVLKTLSSLIAKGVLSEARSAGLKASKEFITPSQAINLREKILNRFSDQHNVGYARVLVISTSGRLSSVFFEMCRKLPGFTMSQKSATDQVSIDNPLGETACLKLHGGMDIVFFNVPATRSLSPLWKAFSTNLVGVIALLDNASGEALVEFASVKREVAAALKAPVVHACVSGAMSEEKKNALREVVGIGPDEPIFMLKPADTGLLQDVFYALFAEVMMERPVA